jgi:AcrR family transcriptional regulator
MPMADGKGRKLARRKRQSSALEPVRTPRERMVLAAAALLSERGVAGTSFAEVIEKSGAPRGSIYHHFPEGKDALTAEAIALVGQHVLARIRRRDEATPKQVVEGFVAAWREVLVQSDCQAGCAIAAVANERLAHPELAARAAAVFVSWEHELAKTLTLAGMPRGKANVAAALILAAVEGALILCRARRELAPLDAVAHGLVTFVEM